MPELPEVETVSRSLEPLLRGRVIESFDLWWPRTLATSDRERFDTAIIGHSIESVGRRAKLVMIHLDSGDVISVHLRMTGHLLFRPDSAESRDPTREAHLRARFRLSGEAELLFYDIRKFGRITLHSPDELSNIEQRFGVEPLGDAFSRDRFRAILSSRARQIKPLLLDQTLVAGLGNIYVDEALFRARIHPLEISRSIEPDRAEILRVAIVSILRDAIERRGTTVRNYRTGLGEVGLNQSQLRVYGLRPGSPCPECGTPVERLVVAQRGSIVCPSCQPAPVTPDRLRRSRSQSPGRRD